MDSQTKAFRAHRALAWFYAFLGVSISIAIIIGSHRESIWSILPMMIALSAVFSIHYFTAQACKQGKKGGRIASIAISCLMLLAFPIGTVIGVYLLSNTWKPWNAAETT